MKNFSMTLNVAFDDPDSMQRFLSSISAAFGAAKQAIADVIGTPAVTPAPTPAAVEAPAMPKKAGRPSKPTPAPTPAPEQPTAEAPTDELPEVEAKPAPAPEVPKVAGGAPNQITLDTLRARANEFVKSRGAPAFRALLEEFGKSRIGELDPGQFRDFWVKLA